MEILWEYASILFLIKYSLASFSIYPVISAKWWLLTLINTSNKYFTTSTFITFLLHWCLFYYKEGLPPLLPVFNLIIYVSVGSRILILVNDYSPLLPSFVRMPTYSASGRPLRLASGSFPSCPHHSLSTSSLLTQHTVACSSLLSYPQSWVSPRSFGSLSRRMVFRNHRAQGLFVAVVMSCAITSRPQRTVH